MLRKASKGQNMRNNIRLQRKRFVKMVGWGIAIIVPAVLGFSFLFSELQMPDGLSIFLIVLLSSILIYIYYLVFEYFDNRKREKYNRKDDPFNK